MSFRIDNRQVAASNQINSNNDTKKRIEGSTKRATFESLLNEQIKKESGVKLSSHAQQRLEQRNISLDNEDYKIINKAIQNAEAKGSRELLLLYNNTAFITNVKNNTIITAVDTKEASDNIFTNIDSAVIINK